MNPRKARIAARFAAAAAAYDSASALQREAAQRLADKIQTSHSPRNLRVLEIGCGTGHLARALMPRIGGDWLFTDIALPMLHACRLPGLHLVMDAERPALAPARFELIVSSLAAQWFGDLPGTLAGLVELLVPGGQLALATLGAGSLNQWRAAHAALGLTAGTPDYPGANALRACLPPSWQATVCSEPMHVPWSSPLEFLRGLRAIGADTPRANARALNPGQMRAVLRQLAGNPARWMTYELLFLEAVKPV